MIVERERNLNRTPQLPQYVIDEMVAYLYQNGLVMKTPGLDATVHIPVNVFPTPFMKNLFEKMEFYQIAFNNIIDRMSRDVEFLHESLQNAAQNDPFINNYLKISKKVNELPNHQKINLGIFRNDYMEDQYKKFAYQIEINTIASSAGTFSDGVKKFHSHFRKKYPEYFEYYEDNEPANYVPLDREDVIDGICDSMNRANILFKGESFMRKTIIVFIIQENERNEFDQRSIESKLWQKYGIKSRRLTIKQLLEVATLDNDNNLFIDGINTSIVYFRSAYTDRDFPDDDCWKAREMIEISTAIKCPNINTFLCTFKLFQYLLQKPEILKKFVPEELIANDISRFFAKIYYVNDISQDEKEKVFKEIREDVKKYIVKPQKEGGGNNFYNEEILELLPKLEGMEIQDEFRHLMIMERINPPEYENVFIHENKLKKVKTVSELSVYGIILSSDKKIYLNKTVGFLMRTKESKTQEGGIVGGFSAVDIPLLMKD